MKTAHSEEDNDRIINVVHGSIKGQVEESIVRSLRQRISESQERIKYHTEEELPRLEKDIIECHAIISKITGFPSHKID
jgi:aspartate/methionine/tyrosine aminotransferase